MEIPKKILHIDPDYRITYFVIRHGTTIKSSLALPDAIQLLKKESFDLIVSEPHNWAILTPQNLSEKMYFRSTYPVIMEVRDGRFR
jgi:hypothetical protein